MVSHRKRNPAYFPAAQHPVIILDDEKSYVDLMTELLSECLSCPVFSFTRPLDALEVLSSVKPAVIVTDYYMPVMNGLDFIQNAHALLPKAAMIMITGHVIDLDEHELRLLPGLRTILHKPLGWKVMADHIVQYWPEDYPPPFRHSICD